MQHLFQHNYTQNTDDAYNDIHHFGNDLHIRYGSQQDSIGDVHHSIRRQRVSKQKVNLAEYKNNSKDAQQGAYTNPKKVQHQYFCDADYELDDKGEKNVKIDEQNKNGSFAKEGLPSLKELI